MDVPAIGKAKGLFEIFIPGVFLLLNFAWMLYCLQYQYGQSPALHYVNDNQTSVLYNSVKDNQILMGTIIIVFGYLAGVILWLLRADTPDSYSAGLRRILHCAPDAFYKEDFPYITSLGLIAQKRLPNEAYSFYSNCWKDRGSEPKNKYFFNYNKVLINAIDEKSAIEIYSHEALIRYLAAMFYALIFPLFLLVIVIFPLLVNIVIYMLDNILRFTLNSGLNFQFLSIVWDSPFVLSLIFLFLYLISIIILLWHFRYMRFKEVQTVFTATLINKEFIDRYLNCNDSEE